MNTTSRPSTRTWCRSRQVEWSCWLATNWLRRGALRASSLSNWQETPFRSRTGVVMPWCCIESRAARTRLRQRFITGPYRTWTPCLRTLGSTLDHTTSFQSLWWITIEPRTSLRPKGTQLCPSATLRIRFLKCAAETKTGVTFFWLQKNFAVLNFFLKIFWIWKFLHFYIFYFCVFVLNFFLFFFAIFPIFFIFFWNFFQIFFISFLKFFLKNFQILFDFFLKIFLEKFLHFYIFLHFCFVTFFLLSKIFFRNFSNFFKKFAFLQFFLKNVEM